MHCRWGGHRAASCSRTSQVVHTVTQPPGHARGGRTGPDPAEWTLPGSPGAPRHRPPAPAHGPRVPPPSPRPPRGRRHLLSSTERGWARALRRRAGRARAPPPPPVPMWPRSGRPSARRPGRHSLRGPQASKISQPFPPSASEWAGGVDAGHRDAGGRGAARAERIEDAGHRDAAGRGAGRAPRTASPRGWRRKEPGPGPAPALRRAVPEP